MFESILYQNYLPPFNKIYMEENDDINQQRDNKQRKKQTRQNWTKEEDNVLKTALKKFGHDWRKISDALKIENMKRGANACRERFQNHLNTNISKKNWTAEETKKLFMLQNKYGNKWKNIAAHLPNRTDNIVKNYFYATVRRVLRRLLKSSGNKKCNFKKFQIGSNLANEIKPCVLGKIFSVCSLKSNKMNVDQKFTIEFREMILKYQNLKFSDSSKVSKTDQTKIQWIYDQLIRINKNYQNDQQNDLELMYFDDIITERIVKQLPIFTTDKIPIEKQYRKVQVIQQIPLQFYQDQQYIYQYPLLTFIQFLNLKLINIGNAITLIFYCNVIDYCFKLPISSYFQMNPQMSQLSILNQSMNTQNLQK
ncbi:hypothetical protein pb186bvf_006390 [Paramecium bursaria]